MDTSQNSVRYKLRTFKKYIAAKIVAWDNVTPLGYVSVNVNWTYKRISIQLCIK